MQACLKDQLGRNIQVYVDDIVIKTKEEASLIDDSRKLRQPRPLPDQAQSGQMRLWRPIWATTRVSHLRERNRSKPEENKSHTGHGEAEKHKGRPAAGWANRGSLSIYQSDG